MTKLTARPGNALSGIAAIPGDKSCSHRALILAAMAEGESVISTLNEAEDVMRTMRAVEALGWRSSRLAINGGCWIRNGGTPVVEAMVALVLADHRLLHRGQTGR